MEVSAPITTLARAGIILLWLLILADNIEDNFIKRMPS